MTRISVSGQHGVNPTMGVCLYCQQPDNSIGLLGQMPGDVQAPRYSIITDEPCDACKEHMKVGILFVEALEMKEVEIRDINRRQKTREYPVTSGTFCVVTEDFVRRVVQPAELRDHILRKRMALVTPSDWDAIGLPRENTDNRGKNADKQEGTPD